MLATVLQTLKDRLEPGMTTKDLANMAVNELGALVVLSQLFWAIKAFLMQFVFLLTMKSCMEFRVQRKLLRQGIS